MGIGSSSVDACAQDFDSFSCLSCFTCSCVCVCVCWDFGKNCIAFEYRMDRAYHFVSMNLVRFDGQQAERVEADQLFMTIVTHASGQPVVSGNLIAEEHKSQHKAHAVFHLFLFCVACIHSEMCWR